MSWSGPAERNEFTAYVALLAVDGIGPRAVRKLTRTFGSAQSALDADISDMTERAGVSRAQASRITSEIDHSHAEKIAERVEKSGWTVLLETDSDYPGPLLEVVDRPPILFIQGEITESDLNSIAIVGSRRATDEGRNFAQTLAAELVRSEVTVISGMARGIDQAAHRGALDAGGRTIAVLGSALDYPMQPADRRFLDRIAGSGAVVSEFLPGSPTLPEHFPQRNRIISGLSQGVVVVEAGHRSGALLTAQNAIDQNRELFSVPGFPKRAMSIGTNELIKQGANALTSAEDIFKHLPRLKRQVSARRTLSLKQFNDLERSIIESFADGPLQIDKLSEKLKLPVSEVMPTLLALELKGVVRELSGKRFALAE